MSDTCPYCKGTGKIEATLAVRLVALRQRRGVTQDEVADVAKVQNEGRTVSECVSHAVRTRDGEISRLREAIIEACDLLMERKQGSPSRSPSHNARLRLEEAIGHWNGRALSPDNSTQKKEG